MEILKPENEIVLNFLEKINQDIREFIKTSIESSSDVDSWDFAHNEFDTLKCWLLKNCRRSQCPSFENEEGRCWLIAGTLCNGEVQGEFASKYQTCLECDVFKHICHEPLRSLNENVNILIYHLQSRARKFREVSIRDSLTGLYNRQYFNEVIEREMARCHRRPECMSFVMIDIDNFKGINDTFGHLTGDKILSECARIIENTVRKSDLVFRYGGDEFFVLLENAGSDQCDMMVDRLLRVVDDWNKRNAETFGCEISLSTGYAVCDGKGDFQSAINEADQNMYTNKSQKKG